jgi:hypothetical protein
MLERGFMGKYGKITRRSWFWCEINPGSLNLSGGELGWDVNQGAVDTRIPIATTATACPS